jgi:two-component system CheB/CheR fusion protein
MDNDLQNVLYSTNVATLFLDTQLNIRFFTPATRSLFNIIPGDVGRPLSDLNSLASDGPLLANARTVLKELAPIEREIKTQGGVWYIRRILPYRTQDGGVEGVVITFVDITERRSAEKALEVAKRQAELANVAKSRFLAAASHDLRQPLQTLALLQGQLAKTAVGPEAERLAVRLGETLGAMSGMLNTLLDINQIEAGTVRAQIVGFPLDDLFRRLADEFAYQAKAQGLALRAVSSGLAINSDPRLLEQMIRNLLSNALKYTKRGKVLLGCRRRNGMLSIEIWDTGIGVPQDQLAAIFDEYHQLDNPARETARGLGLGLSIVQRLANLLGHRVHVRSYPGRGSVFAIDVMVASTAETSHGESGPRGTAPGVIQGVQHTGAILVIDDDPHVRELLEILLKDEGHYTAAASDANTALALVASGTVRPDLILADYNLSSGMNGLEVSAKLRERLRRQIPVIILTGDISTGTLRDIAQHDCVQLSKPVPLDELSEVIQRLLPLSQASPHPFTSRATDAESGPRQPVIYIVDDDGVVREAMRSVLEAEGRTVLTYSTCEEFLDAYRPGGEACLVIDAYLPGMNGLELLHRLSDAGDQLPSIMVTGHGDVAMAVLAMKAGASDFIEKPAGHGELLAAVNRTFEQCRDSEKASAAREAAAKRIAGLTPRQREIMKLVLAGHANKNIAADLGISQRSVENHRASIMQRTGANSLPALARLALAAAGAGAAEPPAHRRTKKAAS